MMRYHNSGDDILLAFKPMAGRIECATSWHPYSESESFFFPAFRSDEGPELRLRRRSASPGSSFRTKQFSVVCPTRLRQVGCSHTGRASLERASLGCVLGRMSRSHFIFFDLLSDL